ncbi:MULTISPECIES: GNAT family N-acetyltransferase [Sphingobium]|uniref:GCN5 family acetyltransferase n=1 Tax=Sphingobium baderi TaxID=1332080 RepID=A0A0S3EYY3_9SPHN|nr:MULTISPECIES: GNAT family N-acetyltransferase [Sphingobium]ALR20641.1 GCN5 family acetyltransferase [Sphingobium baderi]WDA38424.1 GNAT family N-acetyltransferase [Sphingobium sp. YC-XJ3]SCW79509.1 Acetyltransferase (GNAT) domain-containing protein [Sphingobium faniae]
MADIRITPPARLTADHDVAGFANGVHASLDDWLRDRALASEGSSARTYVVCNAAEPRRVVGYYTITTAMEQRAALPSAKLRRGMPDRVPLLLIGRLAVDAGFQGIGLGADLLADALRRCAAAAEIAGARAVIVHAIDEKAAAFYARHGFIPTSLGELVMLLPIEAIRSRPN